MSEDGRQACAGCDYRNAIFLAGAPSPDAEDIPQDLLYFVDPRFFVRAETEPDGRTVGSVHGSGERAFRTVVTEQPGNTRRDVEDCGNAKPSLRSSPNSPVHNFQSDVVLVPRCGFVAEELFNINRFIA